MKLIYPLHQISNPLLPLRKAGYQHFIDPKTKSESFIIRTGAGFYPRFHLYLNYKNDNIEFDLHLDQKKPQYKGANAHNAEYDGPVVEKEMNRLKGWIANEFQVLPINESDFVSRDKQKPKSQESVQTVNSEPEPIKRDASGKDLFGGIF